MSEVKIPDTVLVYKALELHPQGMSLESLKERSEVSGDRLGVILNGFAEDGLVSLRDGLVFVTKWWELQRIEVMFQLPWVDEPVFCRVCEAIEGTFKGFRGQDFYTLKPYSHETTLQIILTITSGVALVEFFGAFFRRLGTKAAEFSEKLFREHSKDGVKEICLNATFYPAKSGDNRKFNFEVRASSKEEILNGMQFVERELIPALQAGMLTSDFVKQTVDWKITVWKAKVLREDKPMRILFVAANPIMTSPLDLEEELRSLELELRGVRHRDQITFSAHHAVRPDDLLRYVRGEQPTAIHFSGHGSAKGIVLRSDDGGYTEVSGEILRRFLDGRGVELLVLNGCYTKVQAEAVTSVVSAVVGTTSAVQDKAARRFAVAFYRALGDGLSIGEAFRDGGDAVALHGLKDVFWSSGDLSRIPLRANPGSMGV